MEHLYQCDAVILECECRQTAGDMAYWDLLLLCQGYEVGAYLWVARVEKSINFEPGDQVRAIGHWKYKRFQILRIEKASDQAANDALYDKDNTIKQKK